MLCSVLLVPGRDASGPPLPPPCLPSVPSPALASRPLGAFSPASAGTAAPCWPAAGVLALTAAVESRLHPLTLSREDPTGMLGRRAAGAAPLTGVTGCEPPGTPIQCAMWPASAWCCEAALTTRGAWGVPVAPFRECSSEDRPPERLRGSVSTLRTGPEGAWVATQETGDDHSQGSSSEWSGRDGMRESARPREEGSEERG